MNQSISDTRPFPITGRRILVTVCAFVLAVLVTRNMLVQVALHSHWSLGLGKLIWPHDAELVLLDANIMAQDVDWKQHDPDSVFKIASETHRLDPLHNWPFMLAGSLFERVGESDKAITLFAKSVRLNPRSPAPRIHLIQNLIATHQGEEALTQIIRLAKLRPDQDKLLLQALVVLLVRDPEHRLIARLNAYPDVRDRLLLQASQSPEAEPFMAEMLNQPGIDQRLRWEQVDRLAQRGRNETAYAIWRSSSDTGANEAIFDANFKGLDGPAAFRWQLITNSSVVSEFSRETAGGPVGLDVEMFGDAIAPATQQTVRIAPGPHRLSITGHAIDPPEVGGTMRWEVRCASDDRPLARIGFAMNPKRTTRQADVNIPASGCAFQKIVLSAVPDVGSQPFRMRFTRITID